MKTVIIVQARMTSSRLPGKILREVMGKPLLEFQFERLARIMGADALMIATTVNRSDDSIVDFCKTHKIPFFRGSEDDVLSRYYGAALQEQADVVVRITSDCPLIEPEVVDLVISEFGDGSLYDYASNTLVRTYPRGLDCEVFSFAALKTAFQQADQRADREHVTPFLYSNPGRFRLRSVQFSKDLSNHRWTVDTPEDLILVRNILEAVYTVKPNFTMDDILRVLDCHPEWVSINAHVEQKKLNS